MPIRYERRGDIDKAFPCLADSLIILSESNGALRCSEAPHIARWWVGPRHRALLPVSACIGAGLVLVCDGLARSLLPPAEIPLGLITAAAGGPFFLVLLRRRMRA